MRCHVAVGARASFRVPAMILGVALGAVCGLACSSSSPTASGDALTPAELARAKTLSPLANVEPETSNQYANDAAAATLGQQFYFEKSIAGPIKIASDLGAVSDTGKISCADCHAMSAWVPIRLSRRQPWCRLRSRCCWRPWQGRCRRCIRRAMNQPLPV